MPATSFDQHVNEALALVAAARRPVHEARKTRSAGAPQPSRPRLTLVQRPASHKGSEQ
ncbi:hypothetical protein OG369_43225 [Streptomyces sp. NBC_01221]|uniref:hypothetical protein n=1 Tax=Streptomyces sp. NBC_01221 TaxID=2903782 RepID=UPI002252D294|nr:hypothetical protein [Streptomyces sp. NBC_01221]MCX4792591.1 hypothetical protein [Streptomyces sp. NBC_01221]